MAAETSVAPKPALRGRSRARSKRANAAPSLVICGAGIGGLQLTLAANASIVASGAAFALGVPDRIVAHLRTQRVRVTELDELVTAAADHRLGYLAVIDVALEAAVLAPPAVLIVPGNPLEENSITRALVELCRRREIAVDVHAAVSPADALVNDLGVDVAALGLQTLPARLLLSRGVVPNSSVPLFVPGLDVLLDVEVRPANVTGEALFSGLCRHLGASYPASHLITLITELTGRGVVQQRTTRFSDVHELWVDVTPNSSLYVNPLRAVNRQPTKVEKS